MPRLALLIASTVIAGCGTAERLPPLDVVPADAAVVLRAHWPVVASDGTLRGVLGGHSMANVFGAVGLTDAQVHEFVVFAESSSDPGTFILSGTFDPQTIVERVRAGRGDPLRYGRYPVHPAGNGKWIAELQSGAVVFGPREPLQRVLDVETGVRAAFRRGPLASRMMSRLTDAEPIHGIVVVPQSVQDQATAGAWLAAAVVSSAGFPSIGGLIGDFGLIRGVAYSVGRPDGAVPVRLVAVMPSERAATLVSGGLGIMKRLSTMLPDQGATAEQRQALEQLRQLSVDRDGDLLGISLRMHPREFH